ncbi:hypothetical protein NQ315_003619 [Exocentrus adspersus]|uniref:DDE Tnp4 domain-containing protein n=1 Tax=Exocentrus adspersus TaxID=1586481 RepID=A0AAV8VJD4_9CUCU|nr:hypothetical protein NQ315_003619 [Exocentrus adspersus]
MESLKIIRYRSVQYGTVHFAKWKAAKDNVQVILATLGHKLRLVQKSPILWTRDINSYHETSQAIWDSLHKKVFVKATSENWLKIAKEFENRWNFPHCIGKRIYIIPIELWMESISEFKHHHFLVQNINNYKQFFSIILMAMCDANYKFTFVDIGGMGSESDGGVFSRSKFAKLLQSNQLHLPSPTYIGGFLNCLFPYFIVADEVFPLKENIMRPYPGKFLNKSRIIENTFDILVSRWRIFQGPIKATVENIDKYVQATVCLHNYLKIWEECNPKNTHKYCPPNYIDSDLNGNLQLGECNRAKYL